MIRLEQSIQIGRPRDTVFDVLTDIEKLPQWQTGVIRSRAITEGPVRPGFQFAETAKVGPWKLDTVCTVTEVKPGQRFAFDARSSGPMDYEGRFELQTVAGGTRLTIHATARLKGLWRLLQLLLASDLRRESRSELEALKRLIEAEPLLTTAPAASRS